MDLINPTHIGTRTKKIDITLEKNTKLISQNISKFLSKGDIIYLIGELGVGKTTFVRFLINYLQKKSNVQPTEIPSPTFNIVNEYKLKDYKIMHYDLYRIKRESELKDIGFFENENDSIIFVEWPEIIQKKPENLINLNFNYEENFNKRNLTINTDCKKDLINEFK